MKPRLLDLFCGAGGMARGFQEAGFNVVGVDIKPQPRYAGDEFVLANAMEILGSLGRFRRWIPEDGDHLDLTGVEAVHASPPCPRYSSGSRNWNGRPEDHPDLVGPVREELRRIGLPYSIENVPGAPMENAIQLCGSSFGLRVRRHRLFECSFPILAPPCAHGWQRSNHNRIRSGYQAPEDSVVPVYGGGQAGFNIATCRAAMGIDWMTTDELNDAIPPVYAKHIGEYLMQAVERNKESLEGAATR